MTGSSTRSFTARANSVSRKNRYLGVLLATTTLGSGVLAAPTAFAQSETHTASSVAGLEEVVVTARRREESLQTVPISITAFNAEALERGSVRRSEDLQFVTPGLTFTQGSDSRQNSAFNVRGAGQAFGGNLPSVLVYFADVPLDYHGAATFGVFDMANVQVARGPQGTLFGRNTTAGAVLYVPQAPKNDFGGFATLEIGDYNLHHIQGAVNVPVSDKLKFRIAGDLIRRDGTTLNLTTGHRLDSRRQESIRASVRFEPNDSIKNDLVFQYLHANEYGVPFILSQVRPDGSTAATRSAADKALYDLYGGPTGAAQYLALQAQRGPRTVALTGDPMEARKLTVASNTTTFKFNDQFTFKNILGYERIKTNYRTDIDGTPIDINHSSANLGVPEFSARQWSDEAQVLGQLFDNRLNVIAGFFWLDEKTPETGFVDGRESLSNLTFTGDNLPPPSVYSDSRNSQAIHDTTKAVYAQGTLKVVDQLKVTAGVRYSWDRRESTTGQMSAVANGGPYSCNAVTAAGTRLPAATPQDQCLTTIGANFNGAGYNFSVDWQPDSNTLLYATTRRNFKDGGQNFVNTLNTAQLTYKPEIAKDYEIGAKRTWNLGDVRARTNLALYISKYTDMQRQVTINTGTAVATVIYNAANAEIKGAELEASFSLHDFTLSMFYNYTDAQYKNFVDPGSGADLSANHFVGTPMHSGGATLLYRADLQNLGALEPSATFYAASRYAYNANQVQNPGTFAPGYHLINLRLDWREVGGTSLDIGAYVNNVEDKLYAVAGIGLYGTTLGYNALVYGQPRTYGLQATYRFGK